MLPESIRASVEAMHSTDGQGKLDKGTFDCADLRPMREVSAEAWTWLAGVIAPAWDKADLLSLVPNAPVLEQVRAELKLVKERLRRHEEFVADVAQLWSTVAEGSHTARTLQACFSRNPGSLCASAVLGPRCD